MNVSGTDVTFDEDDDHGLDARLRAAALSAGSVADDLSPAAARTAASRARRTKRVVIRSLIVAAVAAVVVTVVVVPHQGAREHPTSPTSITVTSSVMPPERGMVAMAYFPPAKEVVLFGGDGANAYLNDTWAFDSNGWRRLHPSTSPPVRGYAGLAYDPALRELILYGGCGYCGAPGYIPLRDTWAFDGNDWHELSSARLPSFEPAPLLAWDSTDSQLELLGPPPGYGPNPPNGDFATHPGDRLGRWIWTTSGWAWKGYFEGPQLVGDFWAFVPEPGTSKMLYYVYAPYMGSCVVPVGHARTCGEDPTGLLFSETWTWSGHTFVREHPERAPTSARLVAADPRVDEVVAVAGSKLWGWTGSTWEVRSANVPATANGAAAYDPALGDLVVFGGNPENNVAATWLWNGLQWAPVQSR